MKLGNGNYRLANNWRVTPCIILHQPWMVCWSDLDDILAVEGRHTPSTRNRGIAGWTSGMPAYWLYLERTWGFHHHYLLSYSRFDGFLSPDSHATAILTILNYSHSVSLRQFAGSWPCNNKRYFVTRILRGWRVSWVNRQISRWVR
jgi:hypothetical protein